MQWDFAILQFWSIHFDKTGLVFVNLLKKIRINKDNKMKKYSTKFRCAMALCDCVIGVIIHFQSDTKVNHLIFVYVRKLLFLESGCLKFKLGC